MTSFKQFWTLLRYNATATPFIWLIPLAFGSSLFLSTSYIQNFSSLLTIQNLFFVGILGVWTLTPEMCQPWSTASAWNGGTEFLLTRAVDRSILYRSRASFLYILVFLVPVLGLIESLKSPDLTVTEYSPMAREECLRQVPGASLELNPNGSLSPLISIPDGNVLVKEWHFLTFAMAAVAVQALLILLYPIRYRSIIFYAVFMLTVFVPLLLDLSRIHQNATSFSERLFFTFTANQYLFWGCTIISLFVCHLWCEYRYSRLQQL